LDGVRISPHRDIDPAELAALADGSLDPRQRAAVEARVAGSAELAELLSEQKRAIALTTSAAADVEAPAALRARIEAQPRPRSRRRAAVIGAFAASAAVAAAAVVGVRDSGKSSQRFHAALEPTALLPDARGEATLTKTSAGWRIQLEASGLPRLADGRFYEAWLRNADGALVPIGTFNEGPEVTLWAGASPQTFKILTVTRERADGDQASSGENVLAGAVAP
jgi:anti-sigma-K factor RskA